MSIMQRIARKTQRHGRVRLLIGESFGTVLNWRALNGWKKRDFAIFDLEEALADVVFTR